MKRAFWLAAALLPAAALAQVSGRGLTNYPDIPKAEPFQETVFGIAINDPYRWMEKADRRADLEKWVNASSLHTTTELGALPGREALFQALVAASKTSEAFQSAQLAGGRLFFRKIAKDAQTVSLYVRDGGKERLLFDPMAGRSADNPRAIGTLTVSPNGKTIAIQTSEGGSEVGELRFYDVDTFKERGDVLKPVWGESEAHWIDNATVAYARMRAPKPGEDGMNGRIVYIHTLGTPMSADKPVLGSTVATGLKIEDRESPYVSFDQSSRWVIAGAGGARVDSPIAIGTVAAVKAGKPDWQQIATLDDKINNYDNVGDTLYYLTTKRSSDGEIRSIDLKGKWSLAASRRLVAGIGPIASFAATLDGLYITTQSPYAATKLYFLPKGGKLRAVKLPFIGSGYSYAVSDDRRTFTFGYDGYQRSTIFYRVDGGKLAPLGLQAETMPAAAAMKVVEDWATSADGTKVPLTIVASGAKTGAKPTIIEAYSSYGISGEPYYNTGTAVWAIRGGVYAYCHARGGGELGRKWHEGGQQANKPNAQADLIACGKRLVALGYASPKTMGIFGSSAAGLLIPMAAMKAPDLFAAAVTRVGIVNATRLGVANNGANQFDEMGDPNTEAGFRALAVQDSTLYLPKARGGPDFLFTVGLNDRRVDPWMSAKLVAMMRMAWGDQHLVLIRSDGKAGHGIGSTRNQALEERADIYAFFLNRFGAPGFVK